jgi:hypothetical protein
VPLCLIGHLTIAPNRGSIPGKVKGFLYTSQGRNRFWGIPILLSSRYLGVKRPDRHQPPARAAILCTRGCKMTFRNACQNKRTESIDVCVATENIPDGRTPVRYAHWSQLGGLVKRHNCESLSLIDRSGEVHSISEYTHFPSIFFANLYASLPLMYGYMYGFVCTCTAHARGVTLYGTK